MSAQDSSDIDALAGRLETDPGRFEPTTAFRVAQASDESLAVTASFGLSLVPLPVASFRRKAGKSVLRSTLMGLVGPLGALPLSYSDLAMRETRNKSKSLIAFLDLFGARIDELFIDACEKYRLARLLRWGASESRNSFLKVLFGLTGLGTPRLREICDVEDDLILRFSGFFAARTRNASNLRAMLGEFTGLPTAIELFCGRWFPVSMSEQSRLGVREPTKLGVNAMAGNAIRDYGGSFRVVIGPLDYADYLSLAPGQRRVEEIVALVRLYVGPGLEFDVQVILKKEQIPFSKLNDADSPLRLGWNSWAKIAPSQHDSRDAVIRPAHNVLQTAS